MSKLTFLDSGVLIAAARGSDEVARRAMTVLDDPDRTFASSALVRLEVLPKALRHHRESEARFYETFFQSVSAWRPSAIRLPRKPFCRPGTLIFTPWMPFTSRQRCPSGPKSSSPPKNQRSQSISSRP